MAEFQMSPSYTELLVIDGEAIELEWNIFPGFTSLQILQETQNDLQKRTIEPEKFTEFNDIDWTRKGNGEICISNSEKVKMYGEGFSEGHSTLLDPGDEKKWYRNRNSKPGEK